MSEHADDIVYRRRDVVWGTDPFKERSGAERPFLVLNNASHPFADQQVTTVALTTTPRDAAIEVRDDQWEEGRLPKRSFISPWIVMTRDYEDIAFRVGRLDPNTVDRTLNAVLSYLRESDQ